MPLLEEEYRKEEKINGVIYDMSPSPNYQHGIVDGNIYRIISTGLQGTLCLAFMENLDYKYHAQENNDYVIPDVMIICDRKHLKGGSYTGTPRFIVETLSPATALRDKTVKKDLYQNAGVEEYWIISPRERAVEIYYLENGKYDLAILDVSLPDGSGFDFCKKIRSTSKVPIMFLTAADEETDIIMGLDIGGDDYITKPFKLAIFLSRLNALLRRSENFNTEVTELTSNDISIRLLKGEVYKQGKLLELTASEYKLLCFFMENPDQVLSAEQILGKLWDCNENYIDNNSLTVYIRRLRTKIEDNPGEPKRIVTVRGMGYKWNTVD